MHQTMTLDEKLAIDPMRHFVSRAEMNDYMGATAPGSLEKALLKQRYANLSTAQVGYIEKQKKAMCNYQC